MSDNIDSNAQRQPHFVIEPEEPRFIPPQDVASSAHIDSFEKYMEMYEESIEDPETFWGKMLYEARFKFEKENKSIKLNYNFDSRKGKVFVDFMKGAKTNLSVNCLERNIENGYGDKIAIYWEGNDLNDSMKITYNQLRNEVVQTAKLLRRYGVKKGDRVAIYLPMIIELPIVMLACARIGAIHSVVFAGFSAHSLAQRIIDGKCNIVVTADGVLRGSKLLLLKQIVDQAIHMCAAEHQLQRCIVVPHLHRVTLPNGVTLPETSTNEIDINYEVELRSPVTSALPDTIEWLESEEPLFILYTSGSTGKPKGVVHTQSGYMLYAYCTSKYTFDLHPDTDVYWCTADCGWITGHTYITYGPILNGVSQVLFEGLPTHPSPSRCWQVVEKYKVTKFYTAPTAIRALMAFKKELVTNYDRSSLKILGSVGEPINPAAWYWYNDVVGDKRCAIVDTYWQTETGGHILTPLPGAISTKPGSATLPFFGIIPCILDAQGMEIEGPGEGALCVKGAWPGMMRTIYGDHDRFAQTYFDVFKGYYFTGDGARRDADGYYWVTGRVDDLMNVSGHLLSTAEIESALVSHEAVAEAAVVAAPDDVKGHSPFAFVSLVQGYKLTPELINELKLQVRTIIGPIAIPSMIQNAPSLPKTRSGKITRRILRVIAAGDITKDIGDQTTLADPDVITKLWSLRQELDAPTMVNGTA